MRLQSNLQIRNFSRVGLGTKIEQSVFDFLGENGFKRGDQLPSQSWFAEGLGISLSSLRETFSRLEERGILKIEHGKGTFLNRNLDDLEFHIDLNLSLTQMILNQGMEPGTSEIKVSMEDLPDEMHHFLNNPSEDKVMCLRRVRTADKKPIAYSVAYFDSDFIQYKDSLSACYGSVYDFMMTQTDRPITDTDATIFAEPANSLVSSKLKIDTRAPLLVLRQIHKGSAGEHLIASIEYFYNCKVDIKIKQK